MNFKKIIREGLVNALFPSAIMTGALSLFFIAESDKNIPNRTNSLLPNKVQVKGYTQDSKKYPGYLNLTSLERGLIEKSKVVGEIILTKKIQENGKMVYLVMKPDNTSLENYKIYFLKGRGALPIDYRYDLKKGDRISIPTLRQYDFPANNLYRMLHQKDLWKTEEVDVLR